MLRRVVAIFATLRKGVRSFFRYILCGAYATLALHAQYWAKKNPPLGRGGVEMSHLISKAEDQTIERVMEPLYQTDGALDGSFDDAFSAIAADHGLFLPFNLVQEGKAAAGRGACSDDPRAFYHAFEIGLMYCALATNLVRKREGLR